MKFIVRRYTEAVQYIEVEAETQDAAYDLAVEADDSTNRIWSTWSICSDAMEIERDSIEVLKKTNRAPVGE